MVRTIFRRKITCFYCGKQSLNPRRDGKVPPLFNCPHCESLNHFDENGEITDYVPEDTAAPSPRHLINRPVSPDEFSAPAFCAHCQKNQQIIMNTLAEYLPPEDDPSYDRYIENYPKYKAQLEERFPTVCAECEGLVSQMIHKANYKAKTRGLAQFLAKAEDTREKYRRKESWGLKEGAESVVWFLRGAGWSLTTAMVLAWHVTGVLYTNEQLEMALLDDSWGVCASETVKKSYPDLSCYGVLVKALWRYLPWSILFFGWNYQALAERRHTKATVYGHGEYLGWEVFIFASRMVAWWFLLPQGSGVDFIPGSFKVIHVVLLLVQLASTIVALTRLKLVEPPSISLRDSGFVTSPVSTPPQRHASPDPAFTANPDNDWSSFHSALPQLGPTRKRETTPTPSSPFGRRSSPLNPSPPQPKVEDDPDEMDWKPTINTPLRKNAWNPNAPPKTPQNKPSPGLFAGRPIPNLQPRTPFAARNMNNNPFDSPMDSPASRFTASPYSTVSSFGDGSPGRTPLQRRGGNTSTLLAPPKFFPREEPTGLESLFESNLRVADDSLPNSLEEESAPQRPRSARFSRFGRPEYDSFIVIIRALLALGCNVTFAISANTDNKDLGFGALGRSWALILMAMSAAHKYHFKWSNGRAWDMETLTPVLEFLAAVLITSLYVFPAAHTPTDYAGRVYLFWMFGRELYDGLGVLQTVDTSVKPKDQNARAKKAKEMAARPLSAGRGMTPGGRPRSSGGTPLPNAFRTNENTKRRTPLNMGTRDFVF